MLAAMAPHTTLTLKVGYDLSANTFQFSGDVKEERRSSFIETFLRTQIGAGEDLCPANEVDHYTIELVLDLETDRFEVRTNTGNKGLRDGILMEAVRQLKRRER